eukprot:UN24366
MRHDCHKSMSFKSRRSVQKDSTFFVAKSIPHPPYVQVLTQTAIASILPLNMKMRSFKISAPNSFFQNEFLLL